MALTGQFSELPLPDLLQVLAANRKTCRVYVEVDTIPGELFLERGRIVHAQFGQLFGLEAVYAIIAASDRARFTLQADVQTEKRTVNESTTTVLLEGLRRIDEGLVSHVTGPTSDTSQGSVPPTARDRRALRAGAVAGAVVVIGAALGLAWWSNVEAWRSKPVVPSQAVDAVDLIGADDRKPRLLSGRSPVAPSRDVALLPTIVCRILVRADGTVAETSIFRTRPGLAAFESAALAAVAGYVFEPAVRNGERVAAWINWPVTFETTRGEVGVRLAIKGSDTIGGALGPALITAFEARQSDVAIELEALGSSTGFAGLFDGSADVAASSRPAEPAEVEAAARLGVRLEELVIGYDGIAIVVHRDNPVRTLTLDEIRWLFSGEADDWSKVGAPPGKVQPVSRPSYSGTHGFFVDKVLQATGKKNPFARNVQYLEKNEALTAFVAKNPRAVTYVGLGWARADGVKVVSVTGPDGPVAPTTASIRDGSYPISRSLLMYTRGRPKGPLAEFLRFVLSKTGQTLVSRNGFVATEVDVDAVLDPHLVEQPMTRFRAPPVHRIFFRQGATELDGEGSKVLDEIAETMASRRYRAIIVGHSDMTGARSDHGFVSRARARNIRDLLVYRGVDSRLMEVRGASTSQPQKSNKTIGGRRENRRVDVTLVPRKRRRPPVQ